MAHGFWLQFRLHVTVPMCGESSVAVCRAEGGGYRSELLIGPRRGFTGGVSFNYPFLHRAAAVAVNKVVEQSHPELYVCIRGIIIRTWTGRGRARSTFRLARFFTSGTRAMSWHSSFYPSSIFAPFWGLGRYWRVVFTRWWCRETVFFRFFRSEVISTRAYDLGTTALPV